MKKVLVTMIVSDKKVRIEAIEKSRAVCCVVEIDKDKPELEILANLNPVLIEELKTYENNSHTKGK